MRANWRRWRDVLQATLCATALCGCYATEGGYYAYDGPGYYDGPYRDYGAPAGYYYPDYYGPGVGVQLDGRFAHRGWEHGSNHAEGHGPVARGSAGAAEGGEGGHGGDGRR